MPLFQVLNVSDQPVQNAFYGTAQNGCGCAKPAVYEHG